MVSRVAGELGRIDILVNNAGINIRKPPHALDIAEWNSVIQTNLTSAFLCSQAVYPAMKAAGGGKIINIGSMMSIFGASFAPAYAASKAASCSSPVLRLRLGGRQHPGQRRAAGLDRHGSDQARPREIDGLHDRCWRARRGALGRHRRFAGIAVFLASPRSDFVTGTAIPVDGGYSIMASGIRPTLLTDHKKKPRLRRGFLVWMLVVISTWRRPGRRTCSSDGPQPTECRGLGIEGVDGRAAAPASW
jgi:2-deoxy-D-gluconate 3-dehydrogenase